MSYTISIVQYFELTTLKATATSPKSLSNLNKEFSSNLSSTNNVTIHRYQNFFVNEAKSFEGNTYNFAPFRSEGTVNNLGGDNSLFSVLFPFNEIVIKLVEEGNQNRLSRLKFTTQWLNSNYIPLSGKVYSEYYVGIGAAFSDTTVELRFRNAMDSVSSRFPVRSISRSLVGLLPLNSTISLQ